MGGALEICGTPLRFTLTALNLGGMPKLGLVHQVIKRHLSALTVYGERPPWHGNFNRKMTFGILFFAHKTILPYSLERHKKPLA